MHQWLKIEKIWVTSHRQFELIVPVEPEMQHDPHHLGSNSFVSRAEPEIVIRKLLKPGSNLIKKAIKALWNT